ncbi:hypothetical protein GCM10010187_14030 [Actinomadura coerulea]|nr:hypothetical protein GCM10010187_14030 [Actinomadura coerulea]
MHAPGVAFGALSGRLLTVRTVRPGRSGETGVTSAFGGLAGWQAGDGAEKFGVGGV